MMKTQMLLQSLLVVLILALVVVVISWVESQSNPALAQGGGGSGSGDWMMVASELRAGEGLIYMFNTKKEVLLVYAYHRGRRTRNTGRNRFDGDLQFLAGRYCKWDLLYCQLLPYPTERPKSGMATPAQMQAAFERRSEKIK